MHLEVVCRYSASEKGVRRIDDGVSGGSYSFMVVVIHIYNIHHCRRLMVVLHIVGKEIVSRNSLHLSVVHISCIDNRFRKIQAKISALDPLRRI